VDLDGCRDPATSELASWARDIVDRLDSYTEVSPSGSGIHILVEGELPPGRNRRGDVEMYDEARFFTVTTDHLDGTPTSLERRQDALLGVHYEYVQSPPGADSSAIDLEEATDGAVERDTLESNSIPPAEDDDSEDGSSERLALGSDSALYARYGLDYPTIDDSGLEAALHGLSPSALPSPLPTSIDEIAGPGVDLDDETLLDRAMDSKSGDIIEALYEGRNELWTGRDSRYPSQSEADMGLCFYLGFWTGGDPERMDRLFRDSGLMRGKWDRVHFANGATYGEVCLARTLLQVDDYYSPSAEVSETSDTRSSRTSPQSEGRHEEALASTELVDPRAVEDARRLATKVQQQQRELQRQRERIEELETEIQQYRRILGIQSGSSTEDDVGSVTASAARSQRSSHSLEPTSEYATATKPSELDQDCEGRQPPEQADDPPEESGITNRLRRWFS
jgi:primase-polymerase (primpol)-like protein